MANIPDWSEGTLHEALVTYLPTFVKEPFSESPRVDVMKLHSALDMSHEAVYRWLRLNRIPPKNVEKFVVLANSPSNARVLKQLGRTPPVLEDFARFLVA